MSKVYQYLLRDEPENDRHQMNGSNTYRLASSIEELLQVLRATLPICDKIRSRNMVRKSLASFKKLVRSTVNRLSLAERSSVSKIF